MYAPANTHPMQDAAKMIGIGSRKLFTLLRKRRVLDKSNVPYQKYIDQGYFKVQQGSWVHHECGIQYYSRTVVTNNGIDWLRKLIEEREKKMSQEKFFKMLDRVPRISNLWDKKSGLEIERFESQLCVMSSGEVHIAKFFASIWFNNNNRYGFDLVDAVASLDIPERKIITEWMCDPFWP